MARKRVSRQVRRQLREKLGPLKKHLVAPRTRVLYDEALWIFHAWMLAENRTLPKQEEDLPPLLEEFAETLWQEGESKADLANLLSALELTEARLKPMTRSAWRLYGVWKKNEMSPRCTPMKLKWLRAMAGFALQRGWYKDAFVLLVSYDCLLRSTEGATLRMANFKLNKRKDSCLLILSSSKGQTRTGVQESLMLQDPMLIAWAAALKEMEEPGEPLVAGGACMLRRRFKVLLRDAGLQGMDLQLYSLRRGAATNMFRQQASFDSVADRGRWRNVRTCRIYVDQALQDAASQKEQADNSKLRIGNALLKTLLEE
jgi:hypothetical protein